MKTRGILLILFLLLANSCDRGTGYIMVNNKSQIPIACYVADGVSSGFSYPDTSLTTTINTYCLTENIANSSVILESRFGYSYDWLLSFTQEGILSVFVFDQALADSKGWELTFSGNNYIVRYDLSVKDLELLQGTICFPPSELMRNVRMFPAYEEVVERYPAMVGRPYKERAELE